jgi:hypothetical protein
MLRIKAAGAPTLTATKGQFVIPMDEFAVIKRDVVSKSVTGAATAGTPTINMSDTNGFAIGQTITITGGGLSEDLIVTAVTPSTSLTTATNLVNTYTSVGALVTVKDITQPITGTSAVATVAMTNTTGFRAGQVVVIEDSAGAETCVINTVNAGVSLVMTINFINTYTVARGGKVTVVNGNPAKASVKMKKPFGAAAGSAEFMDCSWDVGVNNIVVTVEKCDAGAGPALPYTWAVAVTADVVGLNFIAEADGE